jgi:hypothetical protein
VPADFVLASPVALVGFIGLLVLLYGNLVRKSKAA